MLVPMTTSLVPAEADAPSELLMPAWLRAASSQASAISVSLSVLKSVSS